MTDRTQIAFAGARYAVPRLAKRVAEAAIAAGLTAAAILAVLTLNAALTGATARRGGSWLKGYDAWLAFVSRSDILGTMLLTAAVTVAFVYWSRGRDRR
ncbi:MAG: hypothetical protein R3D27_00170 [Hyphomicrobiaceae bacterium]